jgi:C_GCAxxG_C_C family probable redox protein
MDRKDLAAELKKSSNCCQAVLLAFGMETGLDNDTLYKIGAAFGSGMGNTEGNCGALVGAEAVLGLMKYQYKGMHSEASALYDEFKRLCGSTICKELKGVESGTPLCSCENCVRNAVAALESVTGEIY